MFTLPSRSGASAPTPLLDFVAGAFAPRVAAAWPAPHAAFLTAPVERRHLICYALHLDSGLSGTDALDSLLTLRLKEAARRVLPDAPDGLRPTLGKLGETAWSGEGYDALLRLLALPGAAKALRHSQRVEQAAVLALARLPDSALRGGLGRLGLSADQAAVLAEALEAVRQLRGAAAEAEAVRRWAEVDSVPRLFEQAIDELHPELPAPPFAGTPRLRPLSSKSALRGAAARYRNCLRSAVGRAAAGRNAFYEWQGPPSAVVEIVLDDLFGWRLDEAKLVRNATVPPHVREQIIGELRSWGVHVGRSGWGLESQLQAAQRDAYQFDPVEQEIAELFGAY